MNKLDFKTLQIAKSSVETVNFRKFSLITMQFIEKLNVQGEKRQTASFPATKKTSNPVFTVVRSSIRKFYRSRSKDRYGRV